VESGLFWLLHAGLVPCCGNKGPRIHRLREERACGRWRAGTHSEAIWHALRREKSPSLSVRQGRAASQLCIFTSGAGGGDADEDVSRVDNGSVSRLNYQWPECEVHPDMLEGVAARPLCLPRGLTGGNEALQRVHSHPDESQERGQAGRQARAPSTSQRGGLLASEASWTINGINPYTYAGLAGLPARLTGLTARFTRLRFVDV